MKRCVDLFISLFAILVLWPAFLLVPLLIKISMGGSILYIQKRAGLYGMPFDLYKFRTMTDGRNKAGQLLSDEDRLTKLGIILRKFSLDELPQLINVLKGDMSLVGPRPLLIDYLPRYTDEQSIRHQVKPGITGWAQIKGRNSLSWEKKFLLDAWYVKNQSIKLDLYILFVTFYKVIQSDGIRNTNHATMPEFKGRNEAK